MGIAVCGFGNVSELITVNKDIAHIASIPLSPLKKVLFVMTASILNGRKKTMWNNRQKVNLQKVNLQELDGGQEE